jgi:7-carboxy-7-deazaguanine synthase (Cx14CxxC type)
MHYIHPVDRRAYAVKEIYLTRQGEGARTGRRAVFCRFTGCNLWSGREEDRATARCPFCDTDFLGTDGPGGGLFAGPEALAEAITRLWDGRATDPYVVFTGGEPLLQLDLPLIDACHRRGFEVAVETNGTRPVPATVDWICVSPKPKSRWVQRAGHELKVVYPTEISPQGLEQLDFERFFLQPLDGPDLARHTQLARAYCRAHPLWQLSQQSHKLWGIP